MNPSAEIFIVTADSQTSTAFATVFARVGFQATVFTDGTFLVRSARTRTPACVLLDICMLGSSGRDILTLLEAADYPAPVLVLRDESDISGMIDAIRKGAFDFVDKRLDADTIATRVREAIDRWEHRRNIDYMFDIALPSLPGYELLTTREREVLFQITAAASVKETGIKLGISPRTVAVHRRRIIQKLGAGNSATLIRAVLTKLRSAQA